MFQRRVLEDGGVVDPAGQRRRLLRLVGRGMRDGALSPASPATTETRACAGRVVTPSQRLRSDVDDHDDAAGSRAAPPPPRVRPLGRLPSPCSCAAIASSWFWLLARCSLRARRGAGPRRAQPQGALRRALAPACMHDDEREEQRGDQQLGQAKHQILRRDRIAEVSVDIILIVRATSDNATAMSSSSLLPGVRTVQLACASPADRRRRRATRTPAHSRPSRRTGRSHVPRPSRRAWSWLIIARQRGDEPDGRPPRRRRAGDAEHGHREDCCVHRGELDRSRRAGRRLPQPASTAPGYSGYRSRSSTSAATRTTPQRPTNSSASVPASWCPDLHRQRPR